MPHTSTVRNPWQVDHSDSENEIDDQFDLEAPLPRKLSTPVPPRITPRRSEPIIPDWDPVVNEDKHIGKFGHRKTAPLFEHAPSDHRPIFSGKPNIRSYSLTSPPTSIPEPPTPRSFSLSSAPNSLPKPNMRSSSISSPSNSLPGSSKTLGFNIPETPPATPPNSNSQYDPYALMQDNTRKFIYANIPKDYPSLIRCAIRRDRDSLQKGFFPRFYFYAERPNDGKKILLLVAQKIAKVSRQSEYIISIHIETLSEETQGDGYVGKLREINFMGTEYALYDTGISPNKYKTSRPNARNGLRREFAGIAYNTNLFGFHGPRQINVVIPEPGHNVQPLKDEDTILDQFHKKQFNHVVQVRNKLPEYNNEKKLHMLHWTGDRVIEPSVKNFQLIIDSDDHEEVVMQFGRIDKDIFACDYRYPFSPLQAFGIALSAFDSRFTRE